MFCPKCATANSDQGKFCRACGTNLETVALALAGQLPPVIDPDRTEAALAVINEDWPIAGWVRVHF